MKKILMTVVAIASAASIWAVESAKIRVDTRTTLQGGKVASGVEAVGEPDGSAISVWNTTNAVGDVRDFADGWHVRKADDVGLLDWFALADGETPDHDALVLNDVAVVGGRLAGDALWETGVVRVVRHNVVVPKGTTLTIDPEAIVKFTEEARIVVEDGGALVAKGSWFAELQDDEWVGGDTNLDGTNSVATGAQDWIRGLDEGDYVHVLMLDGAEQVFPTRTYTRGQVYGDLPSVDRYDDGFYFRGWVTNQEDTAGVAADQLAEMDQGALYCCWEAIYLNVSTGLVTFAAYSAGETETFTVESNDKWAWSCDADWLTVSPDGSLFTLTAEPNRSELPRTATIKVARANGRLAREVSVVQQAMAHAAMPQIVTGGDGETFSDYMAQVAVSCTTPGASIFYTTDGSEPSASNGIRLKTYPHEGGVIGVFNIYKSTTVKAIALREDLLDSAVATKRLVRDATLAEAMDIPEFFVSTEGDADWRVVTDETSDGVSAVRSGAMTTDRNRRRNSRISTYVEGQGTLTFKWKVSCETDVTGQRNWDYLAFIADGAVVKRIEGQTDWAEVSYVFTGSGTHVVQWLYTKNGGFADHDPGEDCGWIDQVSWTPAVFASGDGGAARELYVNPSWMFNVGIVGASASDEDLVEAAQADDDGDGFTNEEEGILGTDPKDPDSKLSATITSEDGLVKVGYSPENTASGTHSLSYRVLGVTELGGDWKDVTSMSDEDRQANGYRFFRIKVEIEKR